MLDPYVMTESLPIGEDGLEPVVVELRKKLKVQKPIDLQVIVFGSFGEQKPYGTETSDGLPVQYSNPSRLFPEGTACLCYDSGEREGQLSITY